MDHWQNYATNSNTNSSNKTIPPSLSIQEYSFNTTRPPKAWLYFNIFLTSLCIMSFIYGIAHTLATHQISNSIGAGIVGLFLSIPLGIILIINTILALTLYRHHQYSESFATKNLIFSIIPPLYIIVILTLFFLNPN